MDTTAIILAGGLGTRLRAVVADRPKVLASVAGQPFLVYLLDQVCDAGIRDVVISTGYLAEQFEEVIGTSYRDLRISYAHESSPLGTGGAIRWASQYVDAMSVLVMNGDSYVGIDLIAFSDWHRRQRNDLSIVLASVPDASRYGTVERDGADRVTAFLEKMPGRGKGVINAGVYMIERALIQQIPEGNSSLESEWFPKWLAEGKVRGFLAAGDFIDIGIPESYIASHEFMKRVLHG